MTLLIPRMGIATTTLTWLFLVFLPFLLPVLSLRRAKRGTSRSPVTLIGPPPTIGMMDANHGSVFETVGYLGILLMMLGTVVIVYMSTKKQATAAYNTAESEMYAASDMGKLLKCGFASGC